MHLEFRDLLEFWFQDRARARWFASDEAFDRELGQRFAGTLEAVAAGRCDPWRQDAEGCLALVIALDQLPRNIHRGTPQAYAHDAAARAAAEAAIAAGMDRRVAWDRRLFFYLPLQHSEDLAAQRRSVEQLEAWAGERDGEARAWALDHLAWARHYQDIIARFGRFPHRNAILGRPSSQQELDFLSQPSSAPGANRDAQPAGSPSETSRYMQVNHDLWDGRAEPHLHSAFYDMASFRAGASSLTHIEEAALGDVRGKSLLHLQCHFGQDSLSWARKGATVTGVDFSERAIAIARSLSEELAIPARFECSNVYDLPNVLDEQFDIVFTSYGVIKWLPDIEAWGRIVGRYLKPGGVFFMVEFHPFLYVFDYDKAEQIEHPYFHSPDPITYDEVGSYAAPDLEVVHKAHAWPHTLGEIVNSLIAAGLRIESLVEYPYSTFNCFPFVTQGEPGKYVHASHPGKVPMLYSIRASRPDTP